MGNERVRNIETGAEWWTAGRVLVARRRRRLFALVGAGLAVILVVGWLVQVSWLRPWSVAVGGVEGPLPAGRLLVSAQTAASRDRGTRNGVHKVEPAGGAILLADLRDGSTQVLVDRVALDARLSPDGRTLAYNTDDREVWIFRMGSAEPESIPNLRGIPVWMPDGALVCTHSRTLMHPDDQIGPTCRVTFDGLERTVLPVPESDEVNDISPDGRWLLTTSGRHASQRVGYQTYLIKIDGSEERRLTQDGFNLFPRFTPDGGHVIFTRAQGKQSTICRMNLDGSDLRTLIPGLSPDARARPTPDGAYLLIHERTRLFLTDADGRNPRPIPVSCRPLGMPLDVEPLYIGAAEWVAR